MKENDKVYREDGVSLASLVLAIVARWRSVLRWILIMGVVLAALFGVREAIEQNDPEKKEDIERRNAFLQLQDEQYRASMENSIALLSQTLEQQKAFCQESFQMKINPYEMYTISSTYYVDTDYKILPENYYQDPNLTAPIVKGYAARIDELNVVSTLFDQEFVEGLEKYDWNEYFLKVDSSNASSGILQIKASGSTKEQAELIMALVEQTIESAKPMLESTVCEHEVTRLSSSHHLGKNEELFNFQQEQRSRVEDLTASLTKTVSDYGAWESSKLESVGWIGVAKAVIKFGVIGAVLGGFLSVGGYLIVFLYGGLILEPEEIETCYGRRVFGIGSYDGKAKRLDIKLAKRRGIPAQDRREAGNYLLATSLQQATEKNARICLVGTVGETVLNSLADQLTATGVMAAKPLVCGDVENSAEMLYGMDSTAAIVCVEELARSRHADIRKELHALSALGKTCTGFILLGKVGG